MQDEQCPGRVSVPYPFIWSKRVFSLYVFRAVNIEWDLYLVLLTLLTILWVCRVFLVLQESNFIFTQDIKGVGLCYICKNDTYCK